MADPRHAGRSLITTRDRPKPQTADRPDLSPPGRQALTQTRDQARRPQVGPADFAAWLQTRLPSISERWSSEILLRGLGQARDADAAVERFVRHLVAFLPSMLGPRRDLVEPLWIRSCELFGTFAARRGLAAGEVIEEFQLLRELVIRDLYRDPPLGGRLPLSLREILRLNRGIDRGLTHASVGHTDAMFFQLLEADGGPEATSVAEVADEVEAQLAALTAELAVAGGT